MELILQYLSFTLAFEVCIVVTPKLVSDVLRVQKVEHLDYPGCERLRTVSKDVMISTFCEHPADGGDR